MFSDQCFCPCYITFGHFLLEKQPCEGQNAPSLWSLIKGNALSVLRSIRDLASLWGDKFKLEAILEQV